MAYQVSQECAEFISKWEGYSDKSYADIVGVWTIGYGTTRVDGRKVQPGMTCTREEALHWLWQEAQEGLDFIADRIEVEINQNQVDAITSLTYNIGVGAFSKSTLLRKLNAGDIDGAADEFLKWNKAGGKPVKGLTRRRESERAIFTEGIYDFNL